MIVVCGRYTLSSPGEEIAAVFGLEESPELPPRFNIAPSQEAPVIRCDASGRGSLRTCRWGFVPHWAEAADEGPRSINARSETVAVKPAFRDSFRRRRCLVVGDGFYEWKKTDGRKQPFYFCLPDGGAFAMAGVWDRWERGEGPVETFAILTTAANREVGEVHDRMPMILSATAWESWLDCGMGSTDEAQAVLASAPPDGLLVSRPVSSRVNSPANNDSRLVERVELADDSTPRLF